MIVPGMFVCCSFLISVCMFIVSKALLISSAIVIVRAGGATLWNASFKLTSGCVVSIGCVGFVYLDVVCDELNDCAWNVCLLQLSY